MSKQAGTQSMRMGFTLIEMMIVIGIIALLAALTLGISSSMMRNAEIRKTEDALKLITMALQEWELEKGRSITFSGYEPEIFNGSIGMYDIYADETVGALGFNTQWYDNNFELGEAIMLDAMESRNESLVELLVQSESASLIPCCWRPGRTSRGAWPATGGPRSSSPRGAATRRSWRSSWQRAWTSRPRPPSSNSESRRARRRCRWRK